MAFGTYTFLLGAGFFGVDFFTLGHMSTFRNSGRGELIPWDFKFVLAVTEDLALPWLG